MKWRVLATATFLVGSFASGAVAQEAQPDPLSRLDLRYRLQIDAIIDSARQAGLPWAAVRSKALQGINIKADAPKIVSVVRAYYANLVKSREMLGALGAAEIETGASALTAGVHPEELALFRPTAAGRSPTSALMYLTALISAKQGVPRDDAVAAFAKLWKEGVGDSDFEGLWRNVDQDILSGVSPKAALQTRMRGLPARSMRPPTDQHQENPHS
jgi:hypothetical protein